jgi:large subunit ribosomal protein L9
MRVILRENIENLGKKGDIVNVAPGYGRNYLIPKKIAIEVTSRNMKMIEIEQKALQKGFEKEKASYQEVIDRLNAVHLSFARKTGEKDVIFGSVSSTDIRDALVALGFDVEKKKILLDEPIKRLGNFTVPIKIFHEEKAEVKLEVIKEGEARILEDKKPMPDLVEEEATPEPAEEKKEQPLAEEKKEDISPAVDEESQDELSGVKEGPVSEPAALERVPEEKKEISLDTEELPQDKEAVLEEAQETPEEEVKTSEEAPETEASVETQDDKNEKAPAEEPSVKEMKERSGSLSESLEEAEDSLESTGTASEEPEETADDKDSKETVSKDNT